jgi:5'-nucleotidase
LRDGFKANSSGVDVQVLVEGVWMAEVWISDSDVLAKKTAAFRRVGSGGICVVSDWDRTLTYPKTRDGLDTSSYLAIVHGGYLGEGYQKKMAQLYVKYRKVELTTNMLEADKLRAMNEWWMAAFDLLKRFGLTREMIEDVGRQDAMVLRAGVADFFRALEAKLVPLQIVSAGLGDVIEAFLKARDLKLGHMNVVANWIQFSRQGQVVGCGDPVIHSANKTQLVDLEKLGNRRCVLLLGDTLEDCGMVADFDGGTVIRVGFLNGDTEGNRSDFSAAYDVVVGGNGDFGYVNDFVGTCIEH